MMAISSPALNSPPIEVPAFPSSFTWGTATASYQIEGAVHEDGRGTSIWDTFSHTPGAIVNGDTGDIAADHYHRWKDDIGILKELGVDAYRFSIAWPRIVPGPGSAPLSEGIDFYRRLVAELRRQDIKPVATLYHWDLPQYLEDNGGWASRSTVAAFENYVATIVGALGESVHTWTTLNEPWCSAYLGYAQGIHAPGLKDPAKALASIHHLNLAHGKAVKIIRKLAPASQVSLTLNLSLIRPASDAPEDIAAAERLDNAANNVFLDPVFNGHYPQPFVTETQKYTDWSFVQSGDLEDIAQKIDNLGINYYRPHIVQAADSEFPLAGETTWQGADNVRILAPSDPVTGIGWPVDASGLTELLLNVTQRHPGIPLFVTENGAAYPDNSPEINGVIPDPERTNYLQNHIAAVGEAIASGADVRGYFVWSLLDNFEWAEGYSQRFGIVHVDFSTQKRTWKTSAQWFKALIGTHRNSTSG